MRLNPLAVEPILSTDGRSAHPSLVRYALLPRPQDLVVKSVFVVISYIAGRVASADVGLPVLAVVGSAVALEVLAYQARYMFNDLLDVTLDERHPGRALRRRIPATASKGVVSVLAASRTVAALSLAVVLPGRARPVTVLAVVGVFLVAVPYEAARQRTRMPFPLSRIGQATVDCVAVYVLVGAGYALRTVAGLGLAGSPAWALVGGAAFAWPFGVMFITMFWTLEATAFVSDDWTSLDEGIRHKRHFGPLLRSAGVLPLPDSALPTVPWETKVFAVRPCSRGPWALAAGVAALSAGWLGAMLASGWHVRSLAPWCIGAIVAVSFAGAMGVFRGAGTAGLCGAGVVALMTIVAIVVVAGLGGARHPWVAGLPTGAILASVLAFRTLTYRGSFAFAPRR